MTFTSYWLRVKEEYGYVLIQTYNLLLNFPQGIVYLIDVIYGSIDCHILQNNL